MISLPTPIDTARAGALLAIVRGDVLAAERLVEEIARASEDRNDGARLRAELAAIVLRARAIAPTLQQIGAWFAARPDVVGYEPINATVQRYRAAVAGRVAGTAAAVAPTAARSAS